MNLYETKEIHQNNLNENYLKDINIACVMCEIYIVVNVFHLLIFNIPSMYMVAVAYFNIRYEYLISATICGIYLVFVTYVLMRNKNLAHKNGFQIYAPFFYALVIQCICYLINQYMLVLDYYNYNYKIGIVTTYLYWITYSIGIVTGIFTFFKYNNKISLYLVFYLLIGMSHNIVDLNKVELSTVNTISDILHLFMIGVVCIILVCLKKESARIKFVLKK